MEQISFTDSAGVSWAVREDGGSDALIGAPGERLPGAAWLRFESDLEVRRLWHYPDDWRGLSALQLESLLNRASTVIARFRQAPRQRPAADTEAVRPRATREPAPPPARPGEPTGLPGRAATRVDDPEPG